MCGRFENTLSLASLAQSLREMHPELKFDFGDEDLVKTNIAPTNNIAAMIYSEGAFRLKPMGWGIKFSKTSPLIFNSRIETIKEKPYWTNLLKTGRCVVPMTGFYEWKKEGTRKVPYRIYLPGQPFFFVPGLYLEMQKDKAGGKTDNSEEGLFPKEESTAKEKGAEKSAPGSSLYLSLITTAPNKFIEKIHHRMPVILNPEQALEFLQGKSDDYLKIMNPLDDKIKMEMEETTL